MIDSLHWLTSFKKNANFWDWLRATYSIAELQQLEQQATNCQSMKTYDPLADHTSGPSGRDDDACRQNACDQVVKTIYNRYAADIWGICLTFLKETGEPNALACLAALDCANNVTCPKSFEEFMVRNAMKIAARHVLAGTAREPAAKDGADRLNRGTVPPPGALL